MCFWLNPSSNQELLWIFWESKSVILTNYLTCEHCVTGTYYSSLLVKLWDALNVKRRGIVTKDFFYPLHGNASWYETQEIMHFVQSLGKQLLLHPSYSVDLALSDLLLLPKRNLSLKERRSWVLFFQEFEDHFCYEHWFFNQRDTFYKDGLWK